MAPPASSAARRQPVRGVPAPRPAPKRPPLRLFEPSRRVQHRSHHRSSMMMAGALIVGSLVSVVIGDDLVAQGQIRLSQTQRLAAAATIEQKQLQVTVAELSAPQVVVSEAKQLGMVSPTQIVDLPSVPLNVALPVPNTGHRTTVPTLSSTSTSSSSTSTSSSTPSSSSTAS